MVTVQRKVPSINVPVEVRTTCMDFVGASLSR